jgi:CheY-like chemotaxis protein
MRVLIADDDRMVCGLLEEMVRTCGHEVVATVTGGGLAVIKSFPLCEPDLVFLDVYMPRCNGLTVCHALLSRNPQARVVLMSGMAPENHPFVTGSGATAFLQKPIRLEQVRQLLATTSAALAQTGAPTVALELEPERQVA